MEITCEIAALDKSTKQKLIDLLNSEENTIYVKGKNDLCVPVCTIKKCKECPDELYSNVLGLIRDACFDLTNKIK